MSHHVPTSEALASATAYDTGTASRFGTRIISVDQPAALRREMATTTAPSTAPAPIQREVHIWSPKRSCSRSSSNRASSGGSEHAFVASGGGRAPATQ